MTFLQELIQHARAGAPYEVCGLVVSRGSKSRLIPAKNLADDPINTFRLDPEAWMQVADDETVIGIYHSHPKGDANPSLNDLVGCEASGVAWHIVNLEGNYTCTQPCGFQAPYLGRPYVHGGHDCYAIVRDWYEREWGLYLPDFDRSFEWWESGQNLYVDNFAACGFVELHDQEPEVGDLFLIQVSSRVPNHSAIYVGDGLILHHVQGRLSSKDPYGGMWKKHTTHHLRYFNRGTHG